MTKTSRKTPVQSSTGGTSSKSLRKRRKTPPPGSSGTKLTRVITLLSRPDGATITELMKTTGWQAHSVRGFLSGALKKRKGLLVSGQKDEAGVTRYRIGEGLQ